MGLETWHVILATRTTEQAEKIKEMEKKATDSINQVKESPLNDKEKEYRQELKDKIAETWMSSLTPAEQKLNIYFNAFASWKLNKQEAKDYTLLYHKVKFEWLDLEEKDEDTYQQLHKKLYT